ncbi:MAG: CocE/NonD family hydrolase [Thermoplasmatota archaeon]
MRLAPLACLSLLVAAVVAGCAGKEFPGDAGTPVVDDRLDAEGFVKERFTGVTFLEQDIGGGEGALRLHADIYLPSAPKGADAPTKFPTILLLSPYWGSGTHGEPVGYMPYDFLVERLLPRGYAIVFGDLGGNGGSSGCWDFMGPVERESAYNMVEAIAAQDWSDGQIGMFGLSYDGMTQVMAASDAAPHLVTVVPASALTEAYRGLKMSGVHYGGGWHSTISGYESSSVMGPGPDVEERRAGWVETMQNSPECMADNHNGDAATGAYTDYYKQRDFRPFAPSVTASVFVTQGFEDGAVKPDNLGDWFNGIPTEKKLWVGHWYHQYPTAQNAGRTDMYLTFHRWFDHTLYGVDNGIDREPMVDVQDSLGRWRHESSWPPADAATTRFAVDSDGSLGDPTSATEGDIAFGGPTSVTDIALSDGRGSVVVTSEPLAADLHISGTPAFNASYRPDGPTGYVVARLYDDDRMISQGAFNGIFAEGLEQPQPMQRDVIVRFRLAMYPTDWVVEAGHTLRLVLSTVDGQGWFDPDPSLASFDLQAGKDAQLELPTIPSRDSAVFLTSCGMVLKADVPSCFKDLEDEGVPDS